jgi:hypothetical protein
MGVMKKNWDSKICWHVVLPTTEKFEDLGLINNVTFYARRGAATRKNYCIRVILPE